MALERDRVRGGRSEAPGQGRGPRRSSAVKPPPKPVNQADGTGDENKSSEGEQLDRSTAARKGKRRE